MSHVSTGGGASLKLMSGDTLQDLILWRLNMENKSIIAGNWKMNKTPDECKILSEKIIESLRDIEGFKSSSHPHLQDSMSLRL